MTKIGLVLPGNFPRLTAHVGFGHAWYRRYLKGDLPNPDYIVGISAGALAGLLITQWDEECFLKGERTLAKLKKGHFASLNPKIRNSGGLALFTTLALLSPTCKIKNSYLRFAANAGLVAGAMYVDQRFFKDLFHAESFFVYNNLVKLIGRTADFDKIFSSPIDFEAAAVDINS